jgi:D-alanyl-D-alanine carboxypeptidase
MAQIARSAFAALVAAAALTAGAYGATPRAAALPRATPTFPPATRERLDMAITTWLGTTKAPGVVVGLWLPGRGDYVVARGLADAATNAPMVVADHFRIGGITKAFTVTALLQLADEKRIGLDDPVSKYVPYVPNGKNITLRMLATMTSGLFNYSSDESFSEKLQADPRARLNPRKLLDVAFTQKPAFEPGTGWQYGNTNAVLLGLVIESVTHRKIRDIFAERIFKPLGLRQTSWPHGTAMPAPFASGVTVQTPDGSQADATDWSPSWAFSAGQLVSTLTDLRVWAKACAIGTLVSPAMQKQRLSWVTLPPNAPQHKYGMGIAFDHGWLGHAGGFPGYNSGAYYLPEMGATVVILVNSDIPVGKDDPMRLLFRAIAQIVTPDNVPDAGRS